MTERIPYRGRFAPSPTGALHFGSLVAALGSWMMARSAGGSWDIRIEDLDPPREVRGAAEGQLATLAAFGMASDGEVVRQSERGELYASRLAHLLASGDAFECLCSRSELAAAGGIHRRCIGHAATARPSIRLRMPDAELGFVDAIQGEVRQSLAADVGDVVLRRADGFWAYQLAVVVDDAAQGITHVVRGADLLDSTPRQIHLQRCLALPTPHYAHLPLVLDAEGNKLGKSLHSLPVHDRDPWPALAAAWRFLGQDEAAIRTGGRTDAGLQQWAAQFDPSRIPRSAATAVSSASRTA